MTMLQIRLRAGKLNTGAKAVKTRYIRIAQLAGEQDLGMLAGYVEQAQRGSGRFPPPALPTRGGHRRDVHHRGENRLADIELLTD